MSKKIIIAAAFALALSACKKEKDDVSTPPLVVGQEIKDENLKGTVKGTMLTGKTYYLDGEVFVNEGDTLLMQPGVKLLAKTDKTALIVHGTFISLGTEEQRNVISSVNAPASRRNVPNGDFDTDPAMKGLWGGIIGSTTCKNIIFKWTSLEYTGSLFDEMPIPGLSGNKYYWTITFFNPNGNLILEDCHFYGCYTEGIRIHGGNVCIMRNKFEKMGLLVGDALKLRNDTKGDVAYNLFVGCANYCLTVDAPASTVRQAEANIYNNTFVNSGWRTERPSKHAIWIGQDGRGKIYNNVIVNCMGGLHFNNDPKPDLANVVYGNNYFYADTKEVAEVFYPSIGCAEPQNTDIPYLKNYITGDWTQGIEYDGTALVGLNKPAFVNFTIPCSNPKEYDFTGGLDFDITASSPLVGKGKTDFTPFKMVKVDPNFGATEITGPGKDLGAYQKDGSGLKF